MDPDKTDAYRSALRAVLRSDAGFLRRMAAELDRAADGVGSSDAWDESCRLLTINMRFAFTAMQVEHDGEVRR